MSDPNGSMSMPAADSNAASASGGTSSPYSSFTLIGDIPLSASGDVIIGENIPLSFPTPGPTQDQQDPSIKLFVGQVPRSMEEKELKPHMEKYGEVNDIVIIRDKMTGLHRGCAFVTFCDRFSAERAINELHNRVTLAPSTNPLQVRPAEGQAGAPTQEHKLFIGMIPKNATEEMIKNVFQGFGEIEEVYILHHPVSGQSKGCAFLKYKDRDAALNAIEQVHGKVTMEGGSTTLVVKFADSRRQRMQRARQQIANAASPYWQMPPGAALQFPQLQQMQQQYMQQMQAFAAQSGGAGVSTSNNSGNASSNNNPAAVAAAAAAGANPFMYYNPYAFGAYGYPPYGFPGMPNVDGNVNSNSAPTSAANTASNGSTASESTTTVTETVTLTSVPSPVAATETIHSQVKSHNGQLEGPPGANLFIYHLPHDLTDADLATAFAPFGTVISAKVYMDKNTGESKGFGFVSYDSPSAADAAITSMNGFQIGSKRLKVQHKRVHSKEEWMDGSNSGNDGVNGFQQGLVLEVGEEDLGGNADEEAGLEQSVNNLHLED